MGREDVITERFSIEAKEREKLPAFLKKTMAQANNNCADDKLAVVCLHELNSNHDHDLVVMEYSTFRTIIGSET